MSDNEPEDCRRYLESRILDALKRVDRLGHPCLFLLGENRAVEIQPTTQGGWIPSKREWDEIKIRVDAFYADPDVGSEIANHNFALYQKHDMLSERERPPSARVPRMPAPPPSPTLGYIYLLAAENGRYKIGRTSDLKARIKQIRTASAVTFTLYHSFQSRDTLRVERKLHARFAMKRSHGEWFELVPEDVAWICGFGDFQLDEEVAA